jgi:hypothetical protein
MRLWKYAILIGSFVGFSVVHAAEDHSWSIKADYIEACSCHLFCPCYFNTEPEGAHHCEFNNAIKITQGHVGDVKVDGTKVWLSGNLGGDFSKGEMKGAVMTFDTAVTQKQQEAIKFLMGKIYPVKWGSMEFAVAPILWERNGADGHAKLGAGEGEVVLKGVKGADGQQSVLKNVAYWGAQKNKGFELAKSEHHYKGHGYDYKYKDRNGFMISVESSGNDAKAASTGGSR